MVLTELRRLGRPVSKRSRIEEEAMAGRLGMQRQSGSGNRPGKRGDLRGERWLGELKNTAAATFRVTRGVLDKIAREADAVLLKPFLAIGFWCGALRTRQEDRLYGFRADDLPRALIEAMPAPHRSILGRHSGLLYRRDADQDAPLLLYLTCKPAPPQGWVFVPERTARTIMR